MSRDSCDIYQGNNILNSRPLGVWSSKYSGFVTYTFLLSFIFWRYLHSLITDSSGSRKSISNFDSLDIKGWDPYSFGGHFGHQRRQDAMAFYWSLSSPLVLVFFLGFIHFWPCTAAAGKLHCVARLITKVVKCLKKCLISPSYFLFRVITITFWYSQQRSQKYRFEPKQHKVNMLPIGLARLVVK